jgi:hypothetical protein
MRCRAGMALCGVLGYVSGDIARAFLTIDMIKDDIDELRRVAGYLYVPSHIMC